MMTIEEENRMLKLEKVMWMRGVIAWMISMVLMNGLALVLPYWRWISFALSVIIMLMVIILKWRGGKNENKN